MELVVYVLNDAAYAGGLDHFWKQFVARDDGRRLERSYRVSYLHANLASFIDQRQLLARRSDRTSR